MYLILGRYVMALAVRGGSNKLDIRFCILMHGIPLYLQSQSIHVVWPRFIRANALIEFQHVDITCSITCQKRAALTNVEMVAVSFPSSPHMCQIYHQISCVYSRPLC